MISICLSDKLHQPYRFPLIPGSGDVRRIAEDLGCKAFCISGAGPSLLCLTRDAAFAEKLSAAVAELPHDWQVRDLAVDPTGAEII